MKKAIAAFSCALLAVSFGASAKEWKEIRFGVEPSYPPFEMKNPDGKVTGLDVDLGNALCAELKAKCVWVENPFDGMIPGLKAKKFDGILSSMSITPKRLEQIDFTNRIYITPGRLVAKAGSPLKPTLDSLKGKRVGVQQGSTNESYAKTYWAAKGIDVVSYQSQDLAYADLVSGRIDATLVDMLEASESFLKKPQGKGYAFAGEAIKDEKVYGVGAGIGIRKEDKDLKIALDGALAKLKANGSYKKILGKYFDFDISGD